MMKKIVATIEKKMEAVAIQNVEVSAVEPFKPYIGTPKAPKR